MSRFVYSLVASCFLIVQPLLAQTPTNGSCDQNYVEQIVMENENGLLGERYPAELFSVCETDHNFTNYWETFSVLASNQYGLNLNLYGYGFTTDLLSGKRAVAVVFHSEKHKQKAVPIIIFDVQLTSNNSSEMLITSTFNMGFFESRGLRNGWFWVVVDEKVSRDTLEATRKKLTDMLIRLFEAASKVQRDTIPPR